MRTFALFVLTALAILGLTQLASGPDFTNTDMQVYWLLGTGVFCILVITTAWKTGKSREPFLIGLVGGVFFAYPVILGWVWFWHDTPFTALPYWKSLSQMELPVGVMLVAGFVSHVAGRVLQAVRRR